LGDFGLSRTFNEKDIQYRCEGDIVTSDRVLMCYALMHPFIVATSVHPVMYIVNCQVHQ